jgi:hypothetical protein
VEVTDRTRGTAPGYIFVAAKKGAGQDGPMLVDDLGRLVWFSKNRYATDFKVQRYRGEPVLTWWEGKVVAGHGVGEYVIFDDSYRSTSRPGRFSSSGAASSTWASRSLTASRRRTRASPSITSISTP